MSVPHFVLAVLVSLSELFGFWLTFGEDEPKAAEKRQGTSGAAATVSWRPCKALGINSRLVARTATWQPSPKVSQNPNNSRSYTHLLQDFDGAAPCFFRGTQQVFVPLSRFVVDGGDELVLYFNNAVRHFGTHPSLARLHTQVFRPRAAVRRATARPASAHPPCHSCCLLSSSKIPLTAQFLSGRPSKAKTSWI